MRNPCTYHVKIADRFLAPGGLRTGNIWNAAIHSKAGAITVAASYLAQGRSAEVWRLNPDTRRATHIKIDADELRAVDAAAEAARFARFGCDECGADGTDGHAPDCPVARRAELNAGRARFYAQPVKGGA